MPVPSLQKVVMAMDDQFPILEFLYIIPSTMPNAHLVLPATFRAPQRSYLVLNHFTSPIGLPLLTTAVSLVGLSLRWIQPSTGLSPDHFFQSLSLLPRLQELQISFSSPVPSRGIQGPMLRMQNITQTTLPNLRSFVFVGVSA